MGSRKGCGHHPESGIARCVRSSTWADTPMLPDTGPWFQGVAVTVAVLVRVAVRVAVAVAVKVSVDACAFTPSIVRKTTRAWIMSASYGPSYTGLDSPVYLVHDLLLRWPQRLAHVFVRGPH